MKIRSFIETTVVLSITGLSIYLYFNLPAAKISLGLIILFLIGFLGACAPFIRSPQSEKLKIILKQAAQSYIGLQALL